jgi:hypothetical protein
MTEHETETSNGEELARRPESAADPAVTDETSRGVRADDLAAALAGALDRLQTRLGQTRNSVSRFAVREMEVEVAVELSADPLGHLNFRFARTGEPLHAERLSRVTLRIAATPPDGSAGVWRRDLFDPGLEAEAVPGIGTRLAGLLRARGIDTLGDLIEAGSRARARVELAALARVDRTRVGNWIRHAELLAVRGLEVGHVKVLEHLGLASLPALAGIEAPELAERFNRAIEGKRFEKVDRIGPDQAACWIEAAASFLGERPQPARQALAAPATTDEKPTPGDAAS